MSQKYAVVDINGYLQGFVDSVINQTIPPAAVYGVSGGTVAISDATWSTWITNQRSWKWNGTAIVSVSPTASAPTGANAAIAAQFSGLTITSTGTPAVNGTYPADDMSLFWYGSSLGYIAANSAPPGGWPFYLPTVSGTRITFTSSNLTVLKAALSALLDFGAGCKQYFWAQSASPNWAAPTALPNATVTIA